MRIPTKINLGNGNNKHNVPRVARINGKNASKYITVENATVKGHLDQKSQGLRSTKVKIEKKSANKSEIKIESDTLQQEPNNAKTNAVYIALKDIDGKIYSDQTGKFPRTSNRGMKYVMIFIFMMQTTLWVFLLKIGRNKNF